MGSQLDILKNRLFDKDGLAVKNIKFFPPQDRDVTPEQMATELNRAFTDFENGKFEEAPDQD